MANVMMDFGSMNMFLENKSILVTGATGFIAKILVEKILRIQPNVEKLYLLIRAGDTKSATTRLHDEVLGKDLFKVLREKLGHDFESFMLSKITPIAGDASYENLGLTQGELKELHDNVDFVINVAATTKFDERYDVALGVNSLGVKHIVEFAKKCSKMQLLIHVSTAYVCGEKTGIISETPYEMGETLNGVCGLNIDAEKKLADETFSYLRTLEIPERAIRHRMKNLGNQRAKLYGWPNTYVFTKAMGEMLIAQLRGNLPIVIMRPTIVCSTFKEPFPGWVEGCRTIDSVAFFYGQGRLNFFLADRSLILDLIPADMFVNSIIVAMRANVNQSQLTIYQVGSSCRNPITFKEVHAFHFKYFTENPMTNHKGNHVKVGKGLVLSNILVFESIIFLCYITVKMILNLSGKLGCYNLQHALFNFDKKLSIAKKLVDLYKPYLFFKGIFRDTNTQILLKTARENGLDEDMWNFDPLYINWKDYFINVHLPSVVKYLF